MSSNVVEFSVDNWELSRDELENGSGNRVEALSSFKEETLQRSTNVVKHMNNESIAQPIGLVLKRLSFFTILIKRIKS
ncbi:MAG: hypothetical protein WAK50_15175 [Nitrososphaeraceae archaeon]